MARIPVAPVSAPPRQHHDRDHRSGIPLWVWPLIPLLLGALALALASQGNEDQANQGAQQGTNTGGQAAITDMLTIVNAQDATAYVGQPATFANVQVQNVTGNQGFWIGPSAQQQLFVATDAQNQVQVTPGQSVTLSGVIQRIPAASQIPAEWGLSVGNGTAANQQVYLQAQQVSAVR